MDLKERKAQAFDRIAAWVRSDIEDIAHLISDEVDAVIGPEKEIGSTEHLDWAVERLQKNGLIGCPPRSDEG